MQEINIQRRSPQVNIDTATRNYQLPIASATTLGGIKVGNNLTIEDDGTLNAESTEYNLPVATSSTLGGIKIGNGLSISDGIASVDVDAALDQDSNNPVRNSIITSNISTLTSAIQDAGSSITAISNNLSTLTNSVSTNTSNITALQTTVGNQTTAIETNTSNISNNTSAISNINGSVNLLDGRLSTVEGDITDIQADVTNLLPLSDSSVTEITYSSLLPATSWTSGNLLIVKRGKVGFIYFDLQGNLTITANSSVVIYNFADLVPSVKASATLMSDAGTIVGELDDYSYNLSLINLTQNPITITNLKGSIPLVFE
jgi:hypothetical protein